MIYVSYMYTYTYIRNIYDIITTIFLCIVDDYHVKTDSSKICRLMNFDK